MQLMKVLFFIVLLFFSMVCTGCLVKELLPPYDLRCELLLHPEEVRLSDPTPEFSWVMNVDRKNDFQIAYRLLVASSFLNINHDIGDMWDSGKVYSCESSNVEYAGHHLVSNHKYWWKVALWDHKNKSMFSTSQMFLTGSLNKRHSTVRYSLVTHELKPKYWSIRKRGHYFFDFGKAAFGTITFVLRDILPGGSMTIALGERKIDRDIVDSVPLGSIRFRKISLLQEDLQIGTNTLIISPDPYNTSDQSIKMPDSLGEVFPFRYCELLAQGVTLDLSSVRMKAINYPFDDSASYFSSSNKILNDVWKLCKYSIKATSFCGVYIDGDRERIPYEADAYINQLGHYNVDSEYSLARYSYEYLLFHPTWPTEWVMQSVFMAWMDYMYTGNLESLSCFYEKLKARSLLLLARKDGLISTRTGLINDSFLASLNSKKPLVDIVDWPPVERDDYVFVDINTVVNEFHYKTLVLLGNIANVLGKQKDKISFERQAEIVKYSINKKLFNVYKGLYVDGENVDHTSLHANMFAIAFGIVPSEYLHDVVSFVKSKGMACSVYGAQYLLEALYAAGEDDYALYLMTAKGDRSWPHMIYDIGTTITQEAWDIKYKNNMDLSHAWGAAPANIIPRFVMGVQPVEAGFRKFIIKPMPGPLKHATFRLKTIKGNIRVDFTTDHDSFFKLKVGIPANTTADIYVPFTPHGSGKVKMDGRANNGVSRGRYVLFENVGSGNHVFQ